MTVRKGRVYCGPDGQRVRVQQVAADYVAGPDLRPQGQWAQIDLSEFLREWRLAER